MKFLPPLAAALLILAGCTSHPEKTDQTLGQKDAAKFKVALVLDKGGIDDKSFNASAFSGGKQAEKELGIDLKVVEITDDIQIEPALKSFAQKDYDFIISIGFAQQEAVSKIARLFPRKHFALVDATADAPNVESLMFQEHQGSFLAGALAALKTKTGVIGFVGGMDIPLIRRFELGYQEGAKHIKPKIRILINYVGVTGEAWNNPTKGKELALSQLSQNADIIYHAAGASGQGVFDAIEEVAHKNSTQNSEHPVYAIGVDSNQNYVKPGLILTSMLKRVDVAVLESIRDAKAGKFGSGRRDFGLKDHAIDLAMDDFNKPLISAELGQKIEVLKKEIVDGQIKVSDYYLTSKKK